MPHLVATLIYLSQNYSYYIRGDRSPLRTYDITYSEFDANKCVSDEQHRKICVLYAGRLLYAGRHAEISNNLLRNLSSVQLIFLWPNFANAND